MPGPIVINARAAVRREISGVERWAIEMARRLPALRPGAYEVVAPRPRLAHAAGYGWEQVVLPALATRRRARLVFSPANLAPLAWPRNAVVLHDAVALSHPEWFSPAYARWQAVSVRAIARRAQHVIVPSRFSGDELVALAGADPRRVHVIPGAVDPRFHPGVDPEPARRALGLDRPYVLMTGGLGHRKNLRALEPVAPRLAGLGFEVVAAGVRRSHHAHADDLRGVRGLGYVDEGLLPALYAGAHAFVLPSLHEGFGLTVVEAMRSGVPVASSDRGALPEACGGAAELFDPRDPEAVTAAVLRVVTDEARRRELRAAGSARAAELTWERTASAVDEVLAR